MIPETRVCTKCGVDKRLADFSKAPRGKFGRKASCKECDAGRHARLVAGRECKKPGKPKGAPKNPSDPKTCRKCGVIKTYADFSLHRKETPEHNAVHRAECKTCQSAQARQWYADNTDRAHDNRRRWSLMNEYGISVAEYDKLLRQQGGVCAICGRSGRMERGGKLMRMPVDHCHETGAVRGILCQSCNRALGLLGDDATILRRAITYLMRARNKTADERS